MKIYVVVCGEYEDASIQLVTTDYSKVIVYDNTHHQYPFAITTVEVWENNVRVEVRSF